MSKRNVKNILNGLKECINQENKKLIQSSDGYCYWASFIFNEPTTTEKINNFAIENKFTIPTDYKEFLLLNNGAQLFKGEFEGVVEFFKLEDIKEHSPQIMIDNSYPIGYYTDFGYIMINNTRYEEGFDDYMWITNIEPIKLSCNFANWLDRIIISQGNNYWEWSL